MPTITPPTYLDSRIRDGMSAKEIGVAMAAKPMLVGQTLYRLAGEWYLARSPQADILAAADVVVQGGHWTEVSDEVYAGIIAAGFEPIVLA